VRGRRGSARLDIRMYGITTSYSHVQSTGQISVDISVLSCHFNSRWTRGRSTRSNNMMFLETSAHRATIPSSSVRTAETAYASNIALEFSFSRVSNVYVVFVCRPSPFQDKRCCQLQKTFLCQFSFSDQSKKIESLILDSTLLELEISPGIRAIGLQYSVIVLCS